MAITIRLPVIVDADVLKCAFESAHKCQTEVRIETFFRVRQGEGFAVDVDTAAEVKDYALAVLEKGGLLPPKPTEAARGE